MLRADSLPSESPGGPTCICNEYYETLKKEVLSHATTWLGLEDHMLCKQNKPVPEGQILHDSTYMGI